MTDKRLPFTLSQLETIAAQVGTPGHLNDEAALCANAQPLCRTFAWGPGGFKNFFAVKALPNPYILDLVRQVGMGGDCSSLAELRLCEAAGIRGENIIFTSNDTPAKEFQKADEMGALINLDDISHIEFLETSLGGRLPEFVCFRYNPGPLKAGNAIIGKPEEAKYGFTREQLFEGYRMLRDKGVKRFGLHTMVASNELNPEYFVETAQMLFDLAVEVKQRVGVRIEFLNLGGGIGIPYRPGAAAVGLAYALVDLLRGVDGHEAGGLDVHVGVGDEALDELLVLEQTAVDLAYVGQAIQTAYERTLVPAGLAPMRLAMECGRMIAGPYGYLVSRVLHKKAIYKNYVGLDACMANLMRPGLYGSYHHITVPAREGGARKV